MTGSEEHFVDRLAAQLRDVHLVVGTRVMTDWAQRSGLSLEEVRLLLVLSMTDAPATAADLSAQSGLAIEEVFPALGRLADRGVTHESERRYSLTARGEESVASLDAARLAGLKDYVAGLDQKARDRITAALDAT